MSAQRKDSTSQKGAINLLALLGLTLLLATIPLATKLVGERQETRKFATGPYPTTPSTPKPQEPTPAPTPNSKCACVSGLWKGFGCPTLNQPCGTTAPCRGAGESCGGETACCSGLQCASLPGGKFCAAPTCTNGESRCSGNMVQSCQNGQWRDIQRCDAGCSGGACLQGACSAGATECDGSILKTCVGGTAWTRRSCSYGCSGGGCNVAPTPLAISSLPTGSPLPVGGYTIHPTVPLGGITVSYGLPQFGSTPERPYGFDPFQPCTDPTGQNCEFDPLLALGYSMPALGVAGGLAITSPAWATGAYVGAQSWLSTLPSTAQTALGWGLTATEIGGTGSMAYACSQGNQDACMWGMVGGLAYTETSMVRAIAYQQSVSEFVSEQEYWMNQYAEAVDALRSAGVPLEQLPGEGYVYRQPRGEPGWIVEDPLQLELWQDRLAALEHEFGHEIGRAATGYAPLTRSQVIAEEYMNYSRTASLPYASTEMRSGAERMVNALDQILSWDLPLSTRESMAIQAVSSQTEGEWPLLFLP